MLHNTISIIILKDLYTVRFKKKQIIKQYYNYFENIYKNCYSKNIK